MVKGYTAADFEYNFLFSSSVLLGKKLSLGKSLYNLYIFVLGQIMINGHREDNKIAGPSSKCEQRITVAVVSNNNI